MNSSSLGQRRHFEKPRELPFHRRDLSEKTEADAVEIQRVLADKRTTLASAASVKENGDADKMFHVEGNSLPVKILERQPTKTLRRGPDGAVVQVDRAGRGAAAPLLDSRRADAERATDGQIRGGAIDPRCHSTLAFERLNSKPERSFMAAGRERDDDIENIGSIEENQALEQTTAKNMLHEAIQEIVAQYKTALTELTVNSKVIITKLTIYAGDNIQAAEGIAATVCAHILEVPSEQKLPSLYLLDSIVKNIGRDYIELFAARLPQVFCEAYRQVDPSLHPKMKRLFETWREVFFEDPLLAIEEQLEFNSVPSNKLSPTKTAESPSQRTGHGIHVNPSYVEAQRQRMQQTNRPLTADIPKNSFSTDLGMKVSADNFLDYDYVCTDIGAKTGNQTPKNTDSWEKSWPKEDGSLLSASVNESPKPRYTQGSILDRVQSSPRLLIDAYGNVRVPPMLKSPSGVVLPQRDGSQGRERLKKIWEEERHIWNDKSPRSMENQRHLEVSRKVACFLGDGGKDSQIATDKEDFSYNLVIHDRAARHYDAPLHAANQSLPDTFKQKFERELEMGVVRDACVFGANPGLVQGHQFPADRIPHESPQRLSASMRLKLRPFLLNPPNQPHSSPLLLNADGPSFGLSSVLQRPVLVCQPQVGTQPPQASWVFPPNPSGNGNIPMANQVNFPEQQVTIHSSLPNQAVPMSAWQPLMSLQAPQSQLIQVENTSQGQPSMPERNCNSLAALPLPTDLLKTLKQLQEHLPALQNMPAKHQQSQFQQSVIMHQQGQQQQEEHPQRRRQQLQLQQARHQQHEQDLQLQQFGQTSKADVPQLGAQNSNGHSFLAASVTVSSAESVYPPNKSASCSIPLISGGQPQPLFPASGTIAWLTQAKNSFIAASVHAPHLGQVLQPPLPPGRPPPPSQEGNPPPQVLNTNISTLLSSLVAQGLISATSATPSLQLPYSIPSISLTPSIENMAAAGATAAVVLDGSSGTAVPDSLVSQGPILNVAQHSSVDTRHASVGVEFKTDVLRERHDLVINALYASLLEQCKTCGLRCKSQHDLLKHMERHAPENSTQNFLGKGSRSWFPRKEEWLKGARLSVCKQAVTLQSACKVEGSGEPAVPADEDQAACTLCGEPFEDFYDDETDLWMYKGAVYLNTAPGMASNEGKGPIVHAKCQSTPDVFLMSEGSLSPIQRQNSLLAFRGGSIRHEHQKGELEEDQAWKRARH
ncbi:hypothetical protein GOP47_0019658 [Adiantum capillus-veneris]|uniref:CID domain-containing protein n=1 Tax=Adiantum capillus-veneris TaxID=13818 RepID=A0A9D4UBG3_ADICA|nr:hypothetical protein GOP47_0019658 [Adiantum capillus-veneris]